MRVRGADGWEGKQVTVSNECRAGCLTSPWQSLQPVAAPQSVWLASPGESEFVNKIFDTVIYDLFLGVRDISYLHPSSDNNQGISVWQKDS